MLVEQIYAVTFIVTFESQSREIIAGLEAGADDFIVKPFNPEELKVRFRAAERILGLETRDVTIFASA